MEVLHSARVGRNCSETQLDAAPLLPKVLGGCCQIQDQTELTAILLDNLEFGKEVRREFGEIWEFNLVDKLRIMK